MAMGTEIAQLYATVGADMSDFSKAIKGAKDDLNTFEKGVKGVGDAVGTGLKMATGAVVVGFGALTTGIGAATKSAADMEQRVADIRAVFGDTAPTVEALNDAIMGLGLDPKLKVSANEAADAIEMLSKNGVTWDEIMSGAAKSTILLANATNDDFALAADVATDAMQQFNIGVEDMDSAVNGIIGVTQQSKFDINDYALAIAQAGGVAGSVGVPFEDFNAVIAATSSSFASGSDAGTSYKTFLQRLVPTTNPAIEAMNELGLTSFNSGKSMAYLRSVGVEPTTGSMADLITQVADTYYELNGLEQNTAEGAEQFRNWSMETGVLQSAFFDASGNMKSMAEVAGALQEATMGLSDAQKIEAFSTIFGTDAMRTAFGLAEAGAGTINELKATIGNTSAEEAAATRMDTLRGAFEIFNGIIETLSIGIGQKFLPVVKRVIEWASEMAGIWGPKLIEWASMFTDAIGYLVDHVHELGAVFEDGTSVLSGFLTRLGMGEEKAYAIGIAFRDFRNAVSAVWNTITAAISPFVTWNDVLIAAGAIIGTVVVAAIGSFLAAIAPVVAVVTGVIAIVAALRTAWETDWLGIRTAFEPVFDFIGKGFAVLTEMFKTFTADGKLTTDEVVALWNAFRDHFTSALSMAWEALSAWVGDVVKIIADNLPKWLTTLGEWSTAAWQWIVDASGPALKKLGEWGAALWKWTKDNLPTWVGKLGEWLSALWQWIVDATEPTLKKIGEWGAALWKWTTDNLPIWIGKLSGWATAAWEWIVKVAVPEAVKKIAEWGGALWKWVTDNLPTWTSKISAWAKVAWEWITQTAIPEATKKIAEWGAALWKWASDNAPKWATELGKWALIAWEWITKTAIPTAIQKISDWGTGLWTWVGNNTGSWTRKLGEWATASWEWITKEAIPKAVAKLGEWGGAVLGWVADNLDNWILKLVDWQIAFWEWIGESLPDVIRSLGEWITAVTGWGGEKGEGGSGILTMVGEWIGHLWKWVMTDLWPKLEPKLVELGGVMMEALGKIGQALIDEFLRIGKDMIADLQTGAIEKWEGFKTWLGQKWEDIKTGAATMVSNFLGFGREIIEGLRKGITDKWNEFTSWVQGKWQSFADGFKNFFGIRSPSTVFAEFGENIGEGLQVGLGESMPNVISDMEKYINFTIAEGDHLNDWLTHMPDEIRGSLQKWGEAFVDSGDALNDYLADLPDEFRSHAIEFARAGGDLGTSFGSGLTSGMGTALEAAQRELQDLLDQIGGIGGGTPPPIGGGNNSGFLSSLNLDSITDFLASRASDLYDTDALNEVGLNFKQATIALGNSIQQLDASGMSDANMVLQLSSISQLLSGVAETGVINGGLWSQIDSTLKSELNYLANTIKAMRTAAGLDVPTVPVLPDAPTVPPVPPVDPHDGDIDDGPAHSTPATWDISYALSQLTNVPLLDAFDWITDFADAVNNAFGGNLTSIGNNAVRMLQALEPEDSYSIGPDGQIQEDHIFTQAQTGGVVDAIYTLIEELKGRGMGNQFNVSYVGPQGETAQSLQNLITYLYQLYG